MRGLSQYSAVYTGRLVLRHTVQVWKGYLPFPISDQLPGRGVKELAYVQKRCMQDAIGAGN